jgi:NAD(P)-dependent dehydrogenase (short-subunit alcohol dehydrogenase family)
MASETKVVVVTGASAGLGRAIAHAFAERGAKVALLARNPEALAAAAAECRERGGEALAIPTDVSDADAVERAASEVEEKLGPIDVWVNDAMVSVFSPVKEMEASDYKRVTEVLYLGFVHGTLAALKRMLPRDRGTIIQVGSALSYRSIPLQSAYCACKHAINGFTDSLRCELHHDGSKVRLTNVQMPAMNTMQFDWVKNRMPHNTQPVPPIYEPEIPAGVVAAAGYARWPRREYWVGTMTTLAIVGQQIQDEPRDPAAPNNLYEYVPGTHATRGKFDARSKHHSLEVSLAMNRNWIALGALGLITAAVVATRRRA